MSDETELNIELTEQQSNIESALLGVKLSESAIDQDTLMYQAGWAAAMADCNGSWQGRPATVSDSEELRRDAAATKMWPALAMTFAATTAACLLFIWLPSGDEVRMADNQNAETVVEESVERLAPVVAQNSNEFKKEAVQETRLAESRRTRLLQGIFGFSADRIVAERDAQIKKYVAEAASPSRVSIGNMDADWEAESSAPLTPRSKFVF